jgi:hypothetical protein
LLPEADLPGKKNNQILGDFEGIFFFWFADLISHIRRETGSMKVMISDKLLMCVEGVERNGEIKGHEKLH